MKDPDAKASQTAEPRRRNVIGLALGFVFLVGGQMVSASGLEDAGGVAVLIGICVIIVFGLLMTIDYVKHTETNWKDME